MSDLPRWLAHVYWLGLSLPGEEARRPCAVFKDDDRTPRRYAWLIEKANGFYGWEEPVRAVERVLAAR